jgi:D-sedoheptulose 7-phosphate isomerase
MKIIDDYLKKLQSALSDPSWEQVYGLCSRLSRAKTEGSAVYLCGNGGSAGNAIHLANDFLYGGGGLRVEALSANAAVITCLANDTGYDNIYAEQIRVKGRPHDVLIALSGSGNSPNIVRALETANSLGMQTFAVLGYTGGRCKEVAQNSIHFAIDDMQIAEDLQLMVGHICMKFLKLQGACNTSKTIGGLHHE